MAFLPLLDLGKPFSASEVVQESQQQSSENAHAQGEISGKHQDPADYSSPRSISGAHNRVHFELKSGETLTTHPSFAEDKPVRGRTLLRTPAKDRSMSRLSCRSLRPGNPVSEPFIFRERLLSRDFTVTPEQYFEDKFLEPRPLERLRSCSLSEELHRVATFDDTESLTHFIGHRDTFALLGIQRLHNRAIYLPEIFFRVFAGYIDFETYKALRLSCRHWSQGITTARKLHLRAGIRLPPEILQRIYAHLQLTDFDAARHTCRSWMVAGLEERLLMAMLREGGWMNAAELDMRRLESTFGRKMSLVSLNWLLSKRLATERRMLTGQNQTVDGRWESNPLEHLSSLSLTAVIDFSELAQAKDEMSSGDPPLRFDTSTCQRYLLITKGSTIFIHVLIDSDGEPFHQHQFGGCLRLFDIIQCPSKVLAVSMDTSFDRLSVVVLLVNRLGVVFELRRAKSPVDQSPTSPHLSCSSHSFPARSDMTKNTAGYDISASHRSHPPLRKTKGRGDTTDACSMYENLCSAQDPPKSVAICPQRRCVAFGNSTGIEVHWVDALSGQNLQRWFPLSSPGDCLFFLPNRLGIDSDRKLRMVASAAQPLQTQILATRYPSTVALLNNKGYWDDYTRDDQAWKYGMALSSIRRDEVKTEYYSARPLSDGYHILFSDRKSRQLTVVSTDALDQGRPQWARRFVMEGPPPGWVPFIYTAGSELRWGPRILAGYANENDPSAFQHLWLFTIPPDHFWSDKPLQAMQGEEEGGYPPVAIHGVSIARIPLLTAVSVDATFGDLTLRAFSLEGFGKAYTWQLSSSNHTLQKSVLEDGATIVVMSTPSEDVVMEDVDTNLDWRREHTSSDSGPEVDPFSTAKNPHFLDGPNSDILVDADGDVVMQDAPLEPGRPSPPMPPRTPSPVPPAPLFFVRSPVKGIDAQEDDEGYASNEEHESTGAAEATAVGRAIHVSPVHGNWTESDEWIPQYLAQEGTEIEDEGLGADVLASTRLELECHGL